MLTTTKLSCQGCGAELSAEAAPGQIVACEYCGTRNMVHARGATASAEGGGGSAAGSGGGTPAAAPSLERALWGSGAPPPMTPGYARGVPRGRPPFAGPKRTIGRAILIVVVSVFLVTGVLVYFFLVSDSPPSSGDMPQPARADEAHGAKAEREARQVEGKAKQAERKRRMEERLAARGGGKGAGGGTVGSGGALPSGGVGLPDVGEVRDEGPLQFESDRPLVLDLDGDGVNDVVTRARVGGARAQVVVALSGKDWRELWRSPISGSRAARLHEGGEVVLVSQGNQLRALEPKTGGERWTTSLEDAVSLVISRKDRVAVALRNDHTQELFLATGAPVESRARPIPEFPRDDSRLWLSNLGKDFAPPRAALDRLRFELFYCPDGELLRGRSATRSQGFITTKSTTYGCRAPRALAFATQAKGTRLPFLVGLGGGGKILWEERLTPLETLETVSGTPAADLDGDHLAVAYQLARGASFLAVAELGGGKVLWKKALGEGQKKGPAVRGVVLRGDRVYLRAGTELWVFARSDGERLR